MAVADVVGSQRQRCAALILVAIVLAVANEQLRFINRYIALLGKIPSRAGQKRTFSGSSGEGPARKRPEGYWTKNGWEGMKAFRTADPDGSLPPWDRFIAR